MKQNLESLGSYILTIAIPSADQVMNPPYVELPDSDIYAKQEKLIDANLTFPIGK